jgi:hypothetical protein
MKTLFLTAATLAISASVAVGSASAASDLNVVTHQAVPIGAGTGTFTMSGDLSDAGTFRFTSFLFTSGQGSPVTTEHVSETWTGTAGTLTVEKQCRSEFVGFGATDDCQALVTGGTGAYAELHGTGTCTGFINFITGIASQTCEFSLHE